MQKTQEMLKVLRDDYYGGAGDLTICWIPEGVEFQIEEYDGSESIIIKDEQQWIKA